jgi:DNA polymerase III alpha subunit
VESPAMMNLLRRMKPRTIFDLVQALALVRPGPTESGMKEALLRDREGKPVERDAFLEKILPETRGILLYEEQVMQIADRVAGMPPEDGDLLRRSLKRKGGDPGLRERFFREAKERGYTEGEVGTLWRTMEKFSSYSFNKAHSASYAAMAYQAVYLKVHHTLPYLAAVLNAGGGYYDLGEYVEEAKRQGIRILGPDANRSGSGFGTEDGAIRVGLSSVKGLGPKTVEKIVGERKEGGDFLSVEDFLARSGLSKSELLALIRASVFDALEPRRTRQVLRYFQGLEDMDRVADIGAGEKERMLVDSLGFSPAGDPLDLYEGQRPSRRIRDLKGCVGTTVELVVRVVDARQIPLKTGSRYFYMFEDETGLVEGAGETKCLSFGSPPACCLRGKVRGGGNGTVKIGNCVFLKSF